MEVSVYLGTGYFFGVNQLRFFIDSSCGPVLMAFTTVWPALAKLEKKNDFKNNRRTIVDGSATWNQ